MTMEIDYITFEEEDILEMSLRVKGESWTMSPSKIAERCHDEGAEISITLKDGTVVRPSVYDFFYYKMQNIQLD